MATRPLDGSAPITPRSALLSDVSAAAQSTSSSPVTGETQRMAAQKVMLGRWRARPVSRAIQAGEASRPHLDDCFIFFSLPYARRQQDYLGPTIGVRLSYIGSLFARRTGSFWRPIPHA
ncbi:hypothetical protein CI102_14187 [Trichoderma harzianum]|uniref:Uncharacterized protein n=1 Tax=Trichoderma harzianum CBS 226.95 TaxID=983964 RepID=A0A2T3ZZ94_TRIHA|nr:hypothetical protein M431DRAFT_95897 [Trichoderma harzianum CBS 226.95]PKK41707.1 hypothetical protein CI102_14187 [Trichoderma harzianum]PTB50137.1 hypothetical protein M431DRAFT_95897 [Trichoderma harzianum CBS 226.95]